MTDTYTDYCYFDVEEQRTVRFTGKQIAYAQTSPDSGSPDFSGSVGHWTEISIYTMKSGEYCSAIDSMTQWEGEEDSTTVKVHKDIDSLVSYLDDYPCKKSLQNQLGYEKRIGEDGPAQAIKAMRINAGHTQQETARMLSVSVRTVKRWEAGECPISPAYIELYGLKLAQAGKPVSTMSLQN